MSVTANYTGKPSNKSQWQPTIPVNQSIYEESSTQNAPLGARLEVGDRVFYYGQLSSSANVTAGKVVCAPQMVASHQADILTPVATVAGVSTIKVTLGTAMSANEYAEGYLIVSSGTGNGLSYRIKSHAAAATAANVTVNLYDPIAEPLTATNEVNFVPNLYKGVKVGSFATDLAVGVAPAPITTGNYAWLQTYGPCAIYNSAALAAGSIVAMGTLGYGAVNVDGTTSGSNVQNLIGKNFNLAGTAAEETPIFLTIKR